MHSFQDEQGKQWVACCECTRGGNGQDKDKCSCGWKSTKWDYLGCFLGEVEQNPKKPEKLSRSKERYQKYLKSELDISFAEYMGFKPKKR